MTSERPLSMTQSEHTEYNRTHPWPGSRETCCECGDETGHAGRGDGSIYREMLKDSPGKKAGDEIGPLCIACYQHLAFEGFVEEDE